ncbi:MAG: hypothetical protein AAGG11_19065 [Pseudomonadota bacterium]
MANGAGDGANGKRSNTANDLGAQWQDMIGQWERGFDALATQLMGTEGFARAMNQGQQAGLAFQKTLGEAVNRQLAALDLPTGESIRALHETLLRIERRLDHLEARLPVATAGAADPAVPQPSRTKQPPVEYTAQPAAAGAPTGAPGAGQEAA